MHPTLAELGAALAPIVDLSLTNRDLAAHIPRLAEAVKALRSALPDPPGGSLENLARSHFSGRGRARSAATVAALLDVDAGLSVSAAARKHGVTPSTLFRARAQDAGR